MVAIKSDIFLGWALAQGIQTPLDLAVRSDGYYTTCSQAISSNEEILRVPLSACILADDLESLADRLKFERDQGPQSFWSPYLDALPSLDDKRLLAMPRFWDRTRLEQVTDGGQLQTKMTRDEKKDIDQWALACVDSRANFMGQKYSMTPMLDMINHDCSIGTKAKVVEDKGFAEQGDVLSLLSAKSYTTGDEAFINYGNLSNLDTLADYGFVTKNNLCNMESIDVRLMGVEPFLINVFADGSIDSGVKATLRYQLASSEDLEVFSSFEKGNGLGVLAKPLSDMNELDVHSFIASTLDEEAYAAKSGAEETNGDYLVSTYLSERAKVLDLAIEKIKLKYPDLEF